METARVIFLCVFAAILCMAVQATSPHSTCLRQDEGYVTQVTCTSYKVCKEGRLVTRKCRRGLVLDRDSKKCYRAGARPTACSNPSNCQGKPDGNYPDIQSECRSFITCDKGIFSGRQYCPKGLIFDQAKNQCDFPGKVPSPCGRVHRGSRTNKKHEPMAPVETTHDYQFAHK